MDQLTFEQYILIATAIGGLIYLAICGAWGAVLSQEKHRSLSQGFWLGMLFGPAGLIVVACMPTLAAPIVEEQSELDVSDLAERLRRAPVAQPALTGAAQKKYPMF